MARSPVRPALSPHVRYLAEQLTQRDLEQEIAQVVTPPMTPAVVLPPAFGRGWKSAVRTYRKHVAALADGDADAFGRAVNARNKLYKLANSGEIDAATGSELFEAIEGRGPDALPRIGSAEEAGRSARAARYETQAQALRAEGRVEQSPHSYAGELRIQRGRSS